MTPLFMFMVKANDTVENENEDLKFMSSYFKINQLVINLKTGKP